MFPNTTKKIAKLLDKNKIPYAIIGGIALMAYAPVRTTQDIDLVLGVDLDDYSKIKSIFEKNKYLFIKKNQDEFTKATRLLQVIDKNSGIKIDMVFTFTPFEREAIKRAVNIKFDNYNLRIVSKEDLLIFKLFAGRDVDVTDIRIILLKHLNDLDNKYINKWLKLFDESIGLDLRKKLKEIKTTVKKSSST